MALHGRKTSESQTAKDPVIKSNDVKNITQEPNYGYPVSKPRFEPVTSRIKVRKLTVPRQIARPQFYTQSPHTYVLALAVCFLIDILESFKR
jgi:hypothetical protein